MKKLLMLLVALLVALATIVSAAPKPAVAASALIRCFNCPPGWISSGPPTCRCVRGNL